MLISAMARAGKEVVEISSAIQIEFGNALTLVGNPGEEIVLIERLLGQMLYNH